MKDNDSLDFAKDKISHKFDKLGLIGGNDIALILAANMHTKNRRNSIFVITDQSLGMLHEQILNLIKSETNESIIKFQIIFCSPTHTIFGEFQIDKTKYPPSVKYLHCDPCPPMLAYSEVITPEFVKKVSPDADIEIYDSRVVIQKGNGCTYFAIDGTLMLATSPNHNYAVDVIEHIKKHGQEKETSFEEKNIKYMQSSSLPTRFIRGSHHLDDWGTNLHRKGLMSTVFNTSEKDTIVNKKGETAEKSIQKDLKSKQVTSKGNTNEVETKTLNMRMERKMHQHKSKVMNFIEGKDIMSREFSEKINKFKINGLVRFCEEKIVPKKGLRPGT